MAQQHTVLVLGAGSWGTALALVLARNQHNVLLWGHRAEHIAAIQTERQNTQYLPNISFPPNLTATTDLSQAVANADEIIVVVPSHAFRDTLEKIAPDLQSHARICWATKGLEYKTGLLLHDVARDTLGSHYPLAVLSGPSFAAEVAKDLPTAVTVASDNKDYAQALVHLFHNQNFRPYTSDDIIGVELGGAIKNIMAIAAGIADGLGLGANTRAALITRGLTEMVRLGLALGGHQGTFMGLAGLGDLMLTCTDNQSRNRRFGYALAQGDSIETAQDNIGQVVEGARAAQEVFRVAQKLQIDMPIVEQVASVLTKQCTAQDAVQALLSRQPKQERL